MVRFAGSIVLNSRPVISLVNSRFEILRLVKTDKLRGLLRGSRRSRGIVIEILPEFVDSLDPPIRLRDIVGFRGALFAGASESPAALELGLTSLTSLDGAEGLC